MIRTLGGHPATIDQLRRRARLKAWAAEQWNVPADCPECGIDCGGRCAREVGPHTEIRRCPVCRHLHALQTHDELLCARKRGVPMPRCGGGCGAVVAGEGAVCISCVSAA